MNLRFEKLKTFEQLFWLGFWNFFCLELPPAAKRSQKAYNFYKKSYEKFRDRANISGMDPQTAKRCHFSINNVSTMTISHIKQLIRTEVEGLGYSCSSMRVNSNGTTASGTLTFKQHGDAFRAVNDSRFKKLLLKEHDFCKPVIERVSIYKFGDSSVLCKHKK